jgi:hypothetical protein
LACCCFYLHSLAVNLPFVCGLLLFVLSKFHCVIMVVSLWLVKSELVLSKTALQMKSFYCPELLYNSYHFAKLLYIPNVMMSKCWTRAVIIFYYFILLFSCHLRIVHNKSFLYKMCLCYIIEHEYTISC